MNQALEAFMADQGRMQFGAGEVGEAAEHDSQAASVWDANPFDTSQYFSLPAPPIPDDRYFYLQTTPEVRDRYAVAMGRSHGKSTFIGERGVWQNDAPSARWSNVGRKDAFEMVGDHYWHVGALAPGRHARITGIDVSGNQARVTIERPYGISAGDSFFVSDQGVYRDDGMVGIKRSYASKEVDLYAEGSKPNLVITSPDIAKALKNVYATFREHTTEVLAETAAALKAETERTLFGDPLSRVALEHPQTARDRLKGRTWSFYGEAADDRHDVPEDEAQLLMRTPALLQWQDLPPELHA